MPFMCGISGHYHSDRAFQINPSEVNQAVELLRRRGPDSQNVQILPGLAFGHARLQIIDLNNISNQPMQDSTGRYWIVFNGEIFNYKQLRNELKGPFLTQSDTEVLLQAYIQWGPKCLEKLNGFFAFAIYDKTEHSLFAARDRFGIKPFLYSQKNESFYFSSELKSLLSYPIDKNISTSSLNAFLHLTYIPGSEGIFKSVERLQPGHFLILKNQQLQINRYFDLQKPAAAHLSFLEAQEKLKELANSAADLWVESDAPLGAFLSGGIDSSIVVALTSQRIKSLKTFSVVFPDNPFHNEGPYAQAVAQRYSTDHTEIALTNSNLYNCIDEVLNYLDEPFADSSAIPTFALSQQVRKHVTVALSGDGADEVFGGYEKYRGEILAKKWAKLSPLISPIYKLTRHLPESRDQYLGNTFRKINRFLQALQLNDNDRYLHLSSFNKSQNIDLLLLDHCHDQTWKSEKVWQKVHDQNHDFINSILMKDTCNVLPYDMLTKVDMMSMANSIEVRPMLLDHRIVELAFSLPGSYKVSEKYKKHLLLETFKSLLPECVYNRPKHGFSIELLPFFQGPYWQKINDVFLNQSLIQEQDIFKWAEIEKLLNKIKTGSHQDLQALIWSLLTFQNFWLRYVIGKKTI